MAGEGLRKHAGMRWFRSHIRFGSRLALVALAIQFVLTFSHIDLGGWRPDGAGTTLATLADGVGATAPHKGQPVDKSDRTADQACPICALIQLAATSSPAAAPTLTAPILVGLGRLETPEMPALAAPPSILFRARAPPIA